MLVLALSDAHIPDRAIDLPLKFKKLLGVSNKISQAILLGNCTKSYEFLKFVNDVSSNVVIVRGEYDNGLLPAIVKQGDFKIGCCSGYTVVPKSDPLSLLALARQLDVDILLWGGTHNVEAFTLEGKFFVNPGSCTGVFNTDWPFSIEDEDKQEDTEKKKDQNEETNQNQETGQHQDIKEEDDQNKQNQNQENQNQNQENQKLEESNVDHSQDKDEHKDEDEDEEPVEDDLELPELDIDGSNTPSFCLLDIQGSTCTLYIYIYIDGEVKVDKVVYQKED
ncbi:Metallo-dependent phosphatase-like protein [Zygosaccharomyces rouxii]|nr:Metallo-dependent phosphatase-like protein [Zygosaccharomyces rouxii]